MKSESSEIDEALWNGDGRLSFRRSLGTSVISEHAAAGRCRPGAARAGPRPARMSDGIARAGSKRPRVPGVAAEGLGAAWLRRAIWWRLRARPRVRRLLAAGRRREDGQVAVQPGQRQQPQRARGHGGQPEPAGQVPGAAGGAGQRAEPGSVQEGHLCQVDDHPGDSPARRLGQDLAHRGRGEHIDLAAQGHHHVTSRQRGHLRTHSSPLCVTRCSTGRWAGASLLAPRRPVRRRGMRHGHRQGPGRCAADAAPCPGAPVRCVMGRR
jgi:hypothetical protein